MDGRTELPLLPDGCSLDATDRAARIAEWRALADRSGLERRRDGDELRWSFLTMTSADRDELTRLVAAERSCCSMLSWSVELTATGARVRISGPVGDVDRLAEL